MKSSPKQSLRYLNTVLTVIAFLLTLNLATMWASSPAVERYGLRLDGADDAAAQSISTRSRTRAAVEPAAPPNSAAQRREIADGIKKLDRTMTELVGLFRNGSARVKIENPASDSR